MLVTDYTLRKIMSSNDQGIIAVTGRAHCQRQVAFFMTRVGVEELTRKSGKILVKRR